MNEPDNVFIHYMQVDEMVGADRGKLQAMVEKLAARSTSLGTGRKLGGDAAAGAAAGAGAAGGAAEDTPEARRQRMLAAAEARMKAAGQ